MNCDNSQKYNKATAIVVRRSLNNIKCLLSIMFVIIISGDLIRSNVYTLHCGCKQNAGARRQPGVVEQAFLMEYTVLHHCYNVCLHVVYVLYAHVDCMYTSLQHYNSTGGIKQPYRSSLNNRITMYALLVFVKITLLIMYIAL